MRVNFLESLMIINTNGKADVITRGEKVLPHEIDYWKNPKYQNIQKEANEKITQILNGAPYVVLEIYTKFNSDIPYFEIKNKAKKKILAPASLFKKLV